MLLECADDPLAWTALGFSVPLRLGGVEIRFAGEGGGLRGWALPDYDGPPAVDGIPTAGVADAPAGEVAHPNGAYALDHVVVFTDSVDRTAAALVAAGGDERRRTGPPAVPVAMAFVRFGDTIVEVAEGGGPPRLWGVVAVVEDLSRLDPALVGEAKAAVQPGRRIATVRPEAGLGTAVAFMTPRVRAQ